MIMRPFFFTLVNSFIYFLCFAKANAENQQLSHDDNYLGGEFYPVNELKDFFDETKYGKETCEYKYSSLISYLHPLEQQLLIRANRENTNSSNCFNTTMILNELEVVRGNVMKQVLSKYEKQSKEFRSTLHCLKHGVHGTHQSLFVDHALKYFGREQALLNRQHVRFVLNYFYIQSYRWKYFLQDKDQADINGVLGEDGKYIGMKYSLFDMEDIVRVFNQLFFAEHSFNFRVFNIVQNVMKTNGQINLILDKCPKLEEQQNHHYQSLTTFYFNSFIKKITPLVSDESGLSVRNYVDTFSRVFKNNKTNFETDMTVLTLIAKRFSNSDKFFSMLRDLFTLPENLSNFLVIQSNDSSPKCIHLAGNDDYCTSKYNVALERTQTEESRAYTFLYGVIENQPFFLATVNTYSQVNLHLFINSEIYQLLTSGESSERIISLSAPKPSDQSIFELNEFIRRVYRSTDGEVYRKFYRLIHPMGPSVSDYLPYPNLLKRLLSFYGNTKELSLFIKKKVSEPKRNVMYMLSRAQLKCVGECEDKLPSVVEENIAFPFHSWEILFGWFEGEFYILSYSDDPIQGRYFDFVNKNVELSSDITSFFEDCSSLIKSSEEVTTKRTEKCFFNGMHEDCVKGLFKDCNASRFFDHLKKISLLSAVPRECDRVLDEYTDEKCFEWISQRFITKTFGLNYNNLDKIVEFVQESVGDYTDYKSKQNSRSHLASCTNENIPHCDAFGILRYIFGKNSVENNQSNQTLFITESINKQELYKEEYISQHILSKERYVIDNDTTNLIEDIDASKYYRINSNEYQIESSNIQDITDTRVTEEIAQFLDTFNK